MKIVTRLTKFPITPNMIDTNNHFWNAFDNYETEISANWIVSLMQKRKLGWKPFTLNQLMDFFHKTFPDCSDNPELKCVGED